jgi:hypothetical protein
MLNQLPSPKLQFHIVGASPVEVSVKNTGRGVVPEEVLVEKEALISGRWVTVTVLPAEVELLTVFDTIILAV